MNSQVKEINESAKSIPLVMDVDVLVCGGGPAGMIAAIAAARNGAKTLLVERDGFLGGMATAGLVRGISGVRFEKERIVGGIPWELILRMESLGGAASDAGGAGIPYDFPVDAEIMKYTTAEMVLESGADVLLHSLISDVFTRDRKIGGIVIENKSGRQAIAAKLIVDCTGDADIVARAGLAWEKGRKEDGFMQNMTLVFILGNLDTDKLWKLWENDFDRFGTLNTRLRKMALEAQKKGDIPVFGGPWVRGSIKGVRPGEMYVNMVRRWGDATNVFDLTKAEIEGRRDMMAFYSWLKRNVPEMADCTLVQTGSHIGLRETRRTTGEYVLTKDDIWENRNFPDSVAKGAHPIDIHPPSNKEDQSLTHLRGAYKIPYRSLIPRDTSNILVAGRCFSATHEALATARVMGTCMVMGEAAGTAAALSVQKGVRPKELEIALLQQRLADQGAIF
jgi:ribulose 1,5-bisphosphate synthetase/thiazole synthase